ncbi:patatin-like protein [Gloeobacter violaceus]|nr:patatin-like protein [Gloeobacter violaceus]
MPSFRREFRLGLVVYGGVALAIYMNGVCQEFYKAVRGRGLYKLIKALSDSDIAVDVVSGTSAGGINGVLLSYALANSDEQRVVDFEGFARLWRENGAIDKLLRKAEVRRASDRVESVLNGEGYYQEKLFEALQSAGRPRPVPNGTDEWPTATAELDLFVTGTDLLGRVTQALDNTGSCIEVKNHRSVFLLKHRRGRREEFNPAEPDRLQALAKLCRITSCFPVAFPVVTVKLPTADPTGRLAPLVDPVDRFLVQWGQLDKRELPDVPPDDGNNERCYRLHFVDGGVLDNRPFSHALGQIHSRTAYRPVCRKMFYIDPSPDLFTETDHFKNMPRPNLLRVIGDALIGMPTYESIGEDLEAINRYNEKVRRYRYLLEAKLTRPETYRQPPATGQVNYLYWRIRLVTLRDRVLPVILRLEEQKTAGQAKAQEQTLNKAADLLTSFIDERESLPRREEHFRLASVQVRDLDVEYALRKHRFILQVVCWDLDQGEDLPAAHYNRLGRLAQILSRQIELLEIIKASLIAALSRAEIASEFLKLVEQDVPISQERERVRLQLYAYLLAVHRAFFLNQPGAQPDPAAGYFERLIDAATEAARAYIDGGDEQIVWPSPRTLAGIYDALKAKSNGIDPFGLAFGVLSQVPDPDWADLRPVDLKDSILHIVEVASARLIGLSGLEESPRYLQLFHEYRHLDEELLPYEYLADFQEKEPIELVRISPHDAKMGYSERRDWKDKLAGDALYAFGGFFKRSWRSNDILWGRLDGLNRIVQALVTRESLSHFRQFLKRQTDPRLQRWAASPEHHKGDLRHYLAQELVDGAFAQSPEAERKQLLDSLVALAESQNGLADFDLEDFQKRLVLMGHREILGTDFRRVLDDAIAEQLDWNAQKLKPTRPQTPPTFEPATGYFDRTVSALAAAALAEQSLQKYDSFAKLEQFFLAEYRVGAEELGTDVPRPVLFALASRAALVIRDMVYSLDSRLGRSWVYRTADLATQAGHLLARLLALPVLGGAGLGQALLRLLMRAIPLGVGCCLLLRYFHPSMQVSDPIGLLGALGAFAVYWLLGEYWRLPARRAPNSAPVGTPKKVVAGDEVLIDGRWYTVYAVEDKTVKIRHFVNKQVPYQKLQAVRSAAQGR